MEDAFRIAQILLDLNAVTLSTEPPFTWASGLKAPIYCDNRLIISTVSERRQVCQAFKRRVEAQGWSPDIIAGTATAGIPHAAWLADQMDLPMVYVRSSAKGHGKRNLIEGKLPEGSRVVVIEDLISTGGSSIKAAQALTEAGAKVLAVISVFRYGLRASFECFEEAGLPFASLTDLETLLKVAIESKRIDAEQQASIAQWREDPKAWSDRQA